MTRAVIPLIPSKEGDSGARSLVVIGLVCSMLLSLLIAAMSAGGGYQAFDVFIFLLLAIFYFLLAGCIVGFIAKALKQVTPEGSAVSGGVVLVLGLSLMALVVTTIVHLVDAIVQLPIGNEAIDNLSLALGLLIAAGVIWWRSHKGASSFIILATTGIFAGIYIYLFAFRAVHGGF